MRFIRWRDPPKQRAWFWRYGITIRLTRDKGIIIGRVKRESLARPREAQ